MTHRYPTEVELDQIINWEGDYLSLMDFVGDIWEFRDWGWRQKGRKYWISTGGWSGNESLISAMQDNKQVFWLMCWYSSQRGGHYIFKIPTLMTEKPLRGKTK